MEEKYIEENKRLIEKAKELSEKDELNTVLYKQANELKRKWHYSRDDESLFEKELADEFDLYMNKIFAKLKEGSLNSEEMKKNLIKEAKECLNSDNFKKNSQVMKELLDKWKFAGPTNNKEKDDELWNEFNTVRDEFYTKKEAYYENLKKSYKENEEKKKALIEEAIEANKTENIKELTNKMNDLMNRWKQVKTASKEVDDELWKEFAAQRKIFFNKRDSFYESMKEVYENRKNEKEELILQAKHLLAMSEFTKEEIEQMETIKQKWKEVGSAGRDYENDLWDKFKHIINRYSENKKYYQK